MSELPAGTVTFLFSDIEGLGIPIGLDYFGEAAVWAGDVPRAVRLGAAATALSTPGPASLSTTAS